MSKGAAILGAYKNGYIKDFKIAEKSGDIRKVTPDKKASEYYNKIFTTLYKPFYDFKANIENKA